MPPAGNWFRFSCSIPPLFVLSHSLPMINTTGKLASFCTFLSPLAPSLRIHWPQFSAALALALALALATRHSPLATRHSPLATHHSPLATRHSPLATTFLLRPSPVGDCLPPTGGFQRPNGTRSRRAGPTISLCHRSRQFLRTNQFFFIICSSPLAAAHPLTVLSGTPCHDTVGGTHGGCIETHNRVHETTTVAASGTRRSADSLREPSRSEFMI